MKIRRWNGTDYEETSDDHGLVARMEAGDWGDLEIQRSGLDMDRVTDVKDPKTGISVKFDASDAGSPAMVAATEENRRRYRSQPTGSDEWRGEAHFRYLERYG